MKEIAQNRKRNKEIEIQKNNQLLLNKLVEIRSKNTEISSLTQAKREHQSSSRSKNHFAKSIEGTAYKKQKDK